ncbi:hypothetical protein GCM10011396_10930 [Undibacterium terreum]|uniref:Uncharacterized protein n=1 Tax=Undibacterium terreum TaxID=1224302 RepID=A0A916U9P1_9BURK|nr:hypothetical protein GCM10011396_10930 [Undibacterium terreum]
MIPSNSLYKQMLDGQYDLPAALMESWPMNIDFLTPLALLYAPGRLKNELDGRGPRTEHSHPL